MRNRLSSREKTLGNGPPRRLYTLRMPSGSFQSGDPAMIGDYLRNAVTGSFMIEIREVSSFEYKMAKKRIR